MGIHCLPTFTQAAAQLRGRCGFKADTRPPAASGSETSQNQPITPQFLTKLLGKTSDQQVSAGLIYRSKSVQGTPTPPALQPKTHAAATRILTENFRRTNPAPSSEPRAPNPITWLAALQPLSPTTTEPYSQALTKSKRWQSIQPKPTLSPTHKPRTGPIRIGIIDKNLRL